MGVDVRHGPFARHCPTAPGTGGKGPGWHSDGPPRHPQVSANGNVLRSEIVGSIKMRVFLSGMPELRLGLNDKVLFDNTGRE